MWLGWKEYRSINERESECGLARLKKSEEEEEKPQERKFNLGDPVTLKKFEFGLCHSLVTKFDPINSKFCQNVVGGNRGFLY